MKCFSNFDQCSSIFTGWKNRVWNIVLCTKVSKKSKTFFLEIQMIENWKSQKKLQTKFVEYWKLIIFRFNFFLYLAPKRNYVWSSNDFPNFKENHTFSVIDGKKCLFQLSATSVSHFFSYCEFSCQHNFFRTPGWKKSPKLTIRKKFRTKVVLN